MTAGRPTRRGRGFDCDEASKARPNQHDLPGRKRADALLELLQHPRDGQRREIRLVEVGAMQLEGLAPRRRSAKNVAFDDCGEEAKP